MSNPPIPPTLNEQPKTITGNCQSCKSPLTIPFPPIVQAHHPTADALIIPHTKGITCRCGAYYALAVVNYQLSIAIVPDIKPELNEDRLVEPVSNLIGFPPKKLV